MLQINDRKRFVRCIIVSRCVDIEGFFTTADAGTICAKMDCTMWNISKLVIVKIRILHLKEILIHEGAVADICHRIDDMCAIYIETNVVESWLHTGYMTRIAPVTLLCKFMCFIVKFRRDSCFRTRVEIQVKLSLPCDFNSLRHTDILACRSSVLVHRVNDLERNRIVEGHIRFHRLVSLCKKSSRFGAIRFCLK